MSDYAKNVRPQRMIEYAVTVKFVVLTEKGAPVFKTEELRDSIIAGLPPGTGVGSVHAILDGPVMSTTEPE